MIVQFSRSAKRRRARDSGAGLSKLNSMRPIEQARQAPGPVDIRYRVELETRGMRVWPSPALQVLELP